MRLTLSTPTGPHVRVPPPRTRTAAALMSREVRQEKCPFPFVGDYSWPDPERQAVARPASFPGRGPGKDG